MPNAHLGVLTTADRTPTAVHDLQLVSLNFKPYFIWLLVKKRIFTYDK